MNKDNKKLFFKKGLVLSLSLLMLQSSILTTKIAFAQEEKAEAPTKIEQTEKKEEATEKPQETNNEPEEAENNTEETPADGANQEPSEPEHNIANIVSGELKSVSDDAIYQIEIGYEFDDGSFDVWAKGSGFLITNKDILTAQTLVDTSTTSNLYKKIVKERSDAYSRIGVSLSNENEVVKGIKVYVTNSNGDKIAANNLLSQNGMGIITMPKASAVEVTIFQDANKVNKNPGEEVAIKFDGKDDTKSDAQMVAGKIETSENKDAKSYLVSADTTNGNALGAPILNADGNVIGMVSSTTSPMTAIPNDAIETYLISNGIKYKTVLSVEKEQKAEEQRAAEEAAKKAEEAIVDKKPLEDKIKEIEALDLSQYTDETAAALKASVEEGKKLLDSKEATNDQIRVAVENIDKAKEGLEEKGFVSKVLGELKGNPIVPIIGGVIGIFAIAMVAITIVKKKRNNAVDEYEDSYEDSYEDDYSYSEELRRREEDDLRRYQSQNRGRNDRYYDDYDDRYPGLAPKGSNEVYDEGLDVTARSAPKNLRVPRNANVQGVKYADSRYSETDGVSDLRNDLYDRYDEGDEGTTFLNEAELPTLTRKDTGERFKINDGFIIGKQKSKVDYCITGNSTISRTHAAIRKIGGEYYIEDLSSKNYTYLNGSQIAEYKPALLENGAVVRLSNVEFIFEEA